MEPHQILYPPKHLMGKPLKMWYRMQMQRLTGIANIPPDWTHRVGIEIVSIQINFIHPKAYETWDMQHELI